MSEFIREKHEELLPPKTVNVAGTKKLLVIAGEVTRSCMVELFSLKVLVHSTFVFVFVVVIADSGPDDVNCDCGPVSTVPVRSRLSLALRF